MAQARTLESLSIFSFFMAHIFLVLVFSTALPFKEVDKYGIASYFSLKKELAVARKELSESERRFKKIVENINDVVMLTRPDGIISYLSPASYKVLGYKPEELVGKQLWIIHPDNLEKAKKVHSEALNGKEGSNFEYRIKTKTGETRWVSHSWSVMSHKGKIHSIVSILRDITDRKNMEEEIIRKSEELRILNENLEQKVKERTAEVEKLLRQKDDFINQLSHDLKNPLNPLTNLLPIVERREQDPKSKEILRVINRNVEYMKNLVTKTIQLARLSTPGTEFSFEELNLLDVINQVIEKNRHLFDENQVEVLNKVKGNLVVKADKLRLEELFDNLFANAVKYSLTGCDITIDARKDKELITVSVKDTGIGMTEEHLSHIFDEFYKVDRSRHDLESSGLGLSICKRIVERHGGRIWAESPGLGRGSTFYFTIPAGRNMENCSEKYVDDYVISKKSEI
jgi:PAS domain S-box-containing protein